MDNEAQLNQQLMLDEVLNGLQQSQKKLPSKYFYDEKGSELFEQITYLDEYYLTEAEKEILESNISEITEMAGPEAMLVELGSGSSRKTRLLLDRLSSLAAYVPVDISEEYLLKVVSRLRREYPRISIIPVFADYTSSFELPQIDGFNGQQLVFFPGSTVGNFHPSNARSFLENIASTTEAHSSLLIGVDLKKDPAILEAAYNDSKGITAQFNKNMLRRLNRELGADFNIEGFSHRAFYDEDEGRIEMHLVSEDRQLVHIDGSEIAFDKGESIHTENSYKYSLQEFEELVSEWFSVERIWTDENDYFSLQYLKKR